MSNKDVVTSEYSLLFGDCLERMKEIPDGSIDAIICDPPYIGMVKERWDNMSTTYYSMLFQGFMKESERVLRFGGRFVAFGSNDTLSYLYKNNLLKHRELLVVEKDVAKVSAGRNTKQYNQHVNCTEYVFVATKFQREYVKNILKGKQSSLGLSSKQINELLGVKSNGGGMWSIYTGNNVCEQVPTREKWKIFQDKLCIDVDYDNFEEVFNNAVGLSNVLKNVNFNFKGRQHPTQKPLELMEYLIGRYSRINDKILDMFMGSGSTGVAAINTNRKFLGIEMEEKYFDIGVKRMQESTIKGEIK